MNRLFCFPKFRTGVSVFVLTLFIGLYTGGFFERYVFKFYISQSFSRAEARNLIGKQVQKLCSTRETPEEKGVISGYSIQDFGDVYVEIDWSESYHAQMSKGYFNRCVKIIDSQ